MGWGGSSLLFSLRVFSYFVCFPVRRTIPHCQIIRARIDMETVTDEVTAKLESIDHYMKMLQNYETKILTYQIEIGRIPDSATEDVLVVFWLTIWF